MSNNKHKEKIDKKNRVVIEEVNPKELNEIWEKLSDINKSL